MHHLSVSVTQTPHARFENYKGGLSSYLAYEKTAIEIENLLRGHPTEQNIEDALILAKTMPQGTTKTFNCFSEIAGAYFHLGTFPGYQKAYETTLIVLENKKFFSKELPDIKNFLREIEEAVLQLQSAEANLLAEKIHHCIYQL